QVEDNQSKKSGYLNEHHRLRVSLLRTSYWIRGHFKKFFDQFDLTQQQFNVLSVLSSEHPEALTTKEITRWMLDPYADTSRVVDRLKKKGLVQKTVNKTDKRLVKVTITKTGLELVQTVFNQFESLDSLTDKLTPEEMEQFFSLLKKLRK
ncbi:MAG: MarR family transcriptional regulator, partial [Bacteroidota bacterium]